VSLLSFLLLTMKLIYSPKYEVDIGEHPFNTSKYRLIKEKLEKEFKNLGFIEPKEVDLNILYEVHTKEYVDKVLNLKLSYSEILRLEIPLTKEVRDASLIAVAGTILAAEVALKEKVGIHIGGGWHHAYPDHGEGFCVFNDLACAIKYLEKNYGIKKFAVVDLDVHQGNGTAKIFENNKNVFTYSIHQKEIYPFPKEKSTIDVELSAFTTDEKYLKTLEETIKKVVEFNPEVVLYQAGADIYEKDQLAQLKISKEGIKKRDQIVKESFKDKPVVVTLGGGYAFDINDTVEIHCNTIKVWMSE